MIRKFLALILSFFSLGAGSVQTNMAVTSLEVDGAMVPASALIPYLASLAANGAPGPGDFTFTTNTAGASLTAAQVINGILLHTTTSGTDTLPLAAAVIAQLPGGTNSAGAVVGRTFLLSLFNTQTPGTVTIATNTGWTLAGTMVVAANSVRWFFGQVSTSTTVTLTDIAQATIAA